jgi:hypothetical protein
VRAGGNHRNASKGKDMPTSICLFLSPVTQGGTQRQRALNFITEEGEEKQPEEAQSEPTEPAESPEVMICLMIDLQSTPVNKTVSGNDTRQETDNPEEQTTNNMEMEET